MQSVNSQFTDEQNKNTSEWEKPITDQTEQLQEEADAGEDEQPAQHIYHVYVVKEPETDEEIPPFVEAAPPAGKPQRRPVLLLVMVCIAIVAILSGFATGALLLTPTVTVTIFPEQKTLSTTTTVTLVSGKPQTAEEIPGRVLPVVTMSQQQTIKTTGKGVQEARSASGTITFYNAAPYPQYISAGTLLIATNGSQVVTDQDVTIPAADMPLVGQTTVSAHAVVAGAEGNMPAASIDGPCCLVNVFVKNTTAFTGGTDARRFPMVTKQDVDSVARTLNTSLQHSIQAALQAQVTANETLVAPPSCTTSITPNQQVGSEAIYVTVTVSHTCHTAVYETQALHSHLHSVQTQESRNQLGKGYLLVGSLEIAVTNVTQAKQGLTALTVVGKGVWAYQFTNEQLEKMRRHITGKSSEQATATLLQVPGIKQVSLGEITTALPADPRKIEMVVLYAPNL